MIFIHLFLYQHAAGTEQSVTCLGHVLDDPRIAVLFLGEKSFQRASTTHLASYSTGASRSFPKSKTDYSATSSDEWAG